MFCHTCKVSVGLHMKNQDPVEKLTSCQMRQYDYCRSERHDLEHDLLYHFCGHCKNRLPLNREGNLWKYCNAHRCYVRKQTLAGVCDGANR